MNTLRFVLPLVRPYLCSYGLGVLLVPLSTTCALLVPRLTGTAIDQLAEDRQNLQPLFILGGWILLCAVGRAIGLFGTRQFIISASRRMEYDLRNRLFSHLTSLDRPFFNEARTGDLMSRATTDVEAVRTMAGPGVMYSVSTAFMLALAIPWMLSVDVALTALIMVPLSLLSVSVRLIGPRVQAASLRTQRSLAAVSSYAQENFGGIRVVKSFAIEDREIAGFRAQCDEYFENAFRTERISNWMHPVVGAVAHLAVILLLLVGGSQILAGRLTLGEFIQFSGYQAMLIWPMISIGWVVNQVFRGIASAERLREIFARRSSIVEATTVTAPDNGDRRDAPASARSGANSTLHGDIEIRDLSFSYGGEWALENVSLRVPSGKTVALVGRTGSGKSTIAQLLPRLYPVPARSIFIDGVDVNDWPLATLRRAIGVVPQETFLFSRTIAENIAFGISGEMRPDWRERATRFAALSRLEQDIDQFSEGLDARVGERGVTLSGGQRQRVAIARALLFRPRILIFDDSLSSVDVHTEEEILRNLRAFTRDVTVLVISHRIASVKNADYIYVLDEGRILEEGVHEDLVRAGGLYAQLYRLQQLERELEDL